MNSDDTTSKVTFGGMAENSLSGFIYLHHYKQVKETSSGNDIWVIELADIQTDGSSIKTDTLDTAVLTPQSPYIELDSASYEKFHE